LLIKEKSLQVFHNEEAMSICLPGMSKAQLPHLQKRLVPLKWRPVVSQRKLCLKRIWKDWQIVFVCLTQHIRQVSPFPESLEMADVLCWVQQQKQPVVGRQCCFHELDLNDCFSFINTSKYVSLLRKFHMKYLKNASYIKIDGKKLVPSKNWRGKNCFRWADFIHLVEFETMDNNLIDVGGVYYKQVTGVPMGSLLAAFIQMSYCGLLEIFSFHLVLEKYHAKLLCSNLISWRHEVWYFSYTRFKDNMNLFSSPPLLPLLEDTLADLFGMGIKREGSGKDFKPLNLNVGAVSENPHIPTTITLSNWAINENGFNLYHLFPKIRFVTENDKENVHSVIQGTLHRCCVFATSVQDQLCNCVNACKSFLVRGVPYNQLKLEIGVFVKRTGKTFLFGAYTDCLKS